MPTRRPRVAAIGLNAAQQESIAALCGVLRPAETLREYLTRYDWIETDIAVVLTHDHTSIANGVHVLRVGTACRARAQPASIPALYQCPTADHHNTEREVHVPPSCPEPYRSLATEVCRQLNRSEDPPRAFIATRKLGEHDNILISTTSGRPIAMRLIHGYRMGGEQGVDRDSVFLSLPRVAYLSAWFRAFLADVHGVDPDGVPNKPPRLASPWDWYTPQEKQLEQRMLEITGELNSLLTERERLQLELDAEGVKADEGVRRVLWTDGNDLVASVKAIMTCLGFSVRDMDTDVPPGELKREDLRLTLPECPGWEAIVEVKGYTRGTKTNDARQLREHRDRYMTEEGRLPDLTLWIANPHRIMDPSSRPFPDKNVTERAEAIGAVYVSVTDLFREWVRVEEGSLAASEVVERLVTSEPGRWDPEPPVPDS